MELVYGYVRDRQLCSPSEFARRHPYPVILFKKQNTGTDGQTAMVPSVTEDLREAARALRREAHQYRVLALHPGTVVSVGRATDNGLVLAEDSVSRKHGRLLVADDGTVSAEDLASDNGTWLMPVQGRKVRLREGTTGPVSDGDTLQWGQVQTRFLTPRSLFDFLTTLLDPRAAPGHE